MDLVQVVIAWNPKTGEVNVSAPTDKVMAYGLLGMAHEVIAARGAEPAPAIIRPTVVPNIGGRG